MSEIGLWSLEKQNGGSERVFVKRLKKIVAKGRVAVVENQDYGP